MLIAVPTVAALALGGISIAGSWQNASADQRSETLASLSAKVSQLAFQLEGERDAIVSYIGDGINGRATQISGHPNPMHTAASSAQLQVVEQQFSYTRPWIRAVEAGIARVGSDYPLAVRAAAQAVTAKLHTLPNLRSLALRTPVEAPDVIGDYNNLLAVLLAFDDQVPFKSTDPQLTSTARAMEAISRYESEESVQRAIVMYGLTADTLSPGMLPELNASEADQNADFGDFQTFATASQLALFSQSLAGSLQDRAEADEQTFGQHASQITKAGIVPADWYGAQSDVIVATHKVEEALATSAVDRARALRDRAVTSAVIVGGILVLVLIFSLLFAMHVGRFLPERRRPVTALGLSASS